MTKAYFNNTSLKNAESGWSCPKTALRFFENLDLISFRKFPLVFKAEKGPIWDIQENFFMSQMEEGVCEVHGYIRWFNTVLVSE
ncbi:hypothetical protein [Enterococcus sp. AZ163]|uniref:hypothetical protein n=1 Tax=Enterococcus sp. AZ163 TaxID=2774638 RepID=UPI003D2DE050